MPGRLNIGASERSQSCFLHTHYPANIVNTIIHKDALSLGTTDQCAPTGRPVLAKRTPCRSKGPKLDFTCYHVFCHDIFMSSIAIPSPQSSCERTPTYGPLLSAIRRQGTQDSSGIIPLAVNDCFNFIKNVKDREYVLRIS